jgi:tetratricopeptide (TPR) repeat protein
LTTSQAGQNFYIGNHPGNNTGTYLPPLFLRADPEFEEVDFKSKAEFIEGKKFTTTEVSSFWVQKTLEIIRSDPGRFIKNLFFKARLFLNKYEIPDNHSYSFFKAYYSGLLRWDPFDFRFAGSLGLAGLILSFFCVKGNHFSRFFPLICLFYLCSIIPFYIFSRYRLPVVSIMIIMSAFFIVFVVEKFRAGNFRDTVFAVMAFLISFALVNSNIKKDDFSPQFGNIAYTFLEQGNHEEALKYYKKAVEANPGFAEPYYFIGKIFVDSGDLKQAEEYFKKSIAIEPRLFVGYSGLGIVSAQLGKNKEAEYFLKKAVELKPYAPEVHNNLGMLYAMEGDLESARREFQKALSIDPDFAQAKQNLERLKLSPPANLKN